VKYIDTMLMLSKVFYQIVKKYVKDSILEIGAGSGVFINHLKGKKFIDVPGIDLLPKHEDVHYGDVTSLTINNESFDTIFATEVVEHLTDEQLPLAIKSIFRILKPKGHFVFSVPFQEDFRINHIVCPNCQHEFHRYGHYQVFTHQRVQELLNEYGFKVVFCKIYALGAMAKIPLGRFFNFIFKKINFESVAKTMVVVCKKK